MVLWYIDEHVKCKTCKIYNMSLVQSRSDAIDTTGIKGMVGVINADDVMKKLHRTLRVEYKQI